MTFFSTKVENWEAVFITLIVYGLLFWLPNLTYVLVGHSKLQRLQFKLAVVGSVVLLMTISVYHVTESYFGVTIALINWLLLIWSCIKKYQGR